MGFYSSTSRELQQQFDSQRLASQLEETRLSKNLSDEDKKLIAQSEYFFLATADKRGHPDCSIKGGNAGFVTIESSSVLAFENYDGNGMFRSLGNIKDNSWVGMLFVSFTGELKKLRINGRAELIGLDDAESPDKITVRIDIEQIFPNCPRYVPEFEKISDSVFNPSEGYSPPEPHWKSKPDLNPYLPKK